ncbi:MAG: BlaI/MecI/CopY family transcriptional regulator [Promethearchaeota archaeon]
MSEKLELESLDKVIQEFAPEVADIYSIREDESEEQQIKTGRLHENRILGIILKFFLEGKKKVTTGEVENEYKKYFKDIARSTISTYLNMLKKESTLYKERDGRIVYYIFLKSRQKI